MTMSPEKASELRDYMVQCMEVEQKTFLSVVQAMPDDKLSYKPEERLQDFANLALHVAGSADFFVGLIESGQVDPAAGPGDPPPLLESTAALTEQIAETFKNTLERYRAFTPDQLAREIDFFGMGSHPGVHYLNWDVVHLVHHRAQLGLYLRLAGEKVPSIYGPTLDVSFEDMVGS